MCNIVTMCLELGLHEDPGKRGIAGREAEVKKQLFWTCFKLGKRLVHSELPGHSYRLLGPQTRIWLRC